jgi:hypothetical protein
MDVTHLDSAENNGVSYNAHQIYNLRDDLAERFAQNGYGIILDDLEHAAAIKTPEDGQTRETATVSRIRKANAE